MATSEIEHPEDPQNGQKLVLSDVLNRVLDKGVVLHGSITIAVADIDLIQLDLSLLLSAIETAVERQLDRATNGPILPDHDRQG